MTLINAKVGYIRWDGANYPEGVPIYCHDSHTVLNGMLRRWLAQPHYTIYYSNEFSSLKLDSRQ